MRVTSLYSPVTDRGSNGFFRFIASEAREVNQTYFNAIAFDKELGGTRGIDAALKAHKLDALLLLSQSSSAPAAIVGYPIVTGQSSHNFIFYRHAKHVFTQYRLDFCPLALLCPLLNLSVRRGLTSLLGSLSWVPPSASSS